MLITRPAFALLAGIAFVSFGAAESLAGACDVAVPVPQKMLCDMKGGNNSADFNGGCTIVPAHDEVKKRDCPPQWVNTSNAKLSHSAACKSAGMRGTTISGAICASGEKQPQNGLYYQTINYLQGQWSGNDPIEKNKDGGTVAQASSSRWNATYYYCWVPGQTKDYDKTDWVVAYACEGSDD